MNKVFSFAFMFLVLLVHTEAQSGAPEPSGVKAMAGSVSLGIVVDNSGSYRTIFDRVVTSTNSIIGSLGEDDEGFLVTFVSTPKIVLRQEMTSVKQELLDASDNMFIEGGATAVLDAVVYSAKYMSAQSSKGERARVLVLITDGDDRESAASVDEAIRIAKEANIRVYVLGLYEEKFYTKVIDRLTRETGGAKFVPKTPKETQSMVSGLLTAIRAK